MKKAVVKIPAKVNLTLDVIEKKRSYHEIKSLVTPINLYDTVIIKRRTDWDITLQNKGIHPGCDKIDNNAYKAAKLFSDTYITEGVDIIVDKNIPVGAGLGGSSADIAGALKAMSELFNPQADIKTLADKLGSDAGYMCQGGWAIISGKGEKVDVKAIDKKLYFILITEKEQIKAGDSYKKFDSLKKNIKPCTEKVYKALIENQTDKFFASAKNDLYLASKELLPVIEFNIEVLKKAGAPLAIMTGSGSTVMGVFTDKKERDKSYKKIKNLYGEQIILAESI